MTRGLSSICKRIPAMAVMFIAAAEIALASPSSQRIPVELWRGGDDGLTLRLAEELENALKSSPHFVLSNGRDSHRLVVTIPGNVDWKQIGKRTRVIYKVDFTDAHHRNLGSQQDHAGTMPSRNARVESLARRRSQAGSYISRTKYVSVVQNSDDSSTYQDARFRNNT